MGERLWAIEIRRGSGWFVAFWGVTGNGLAVFSTRREARDARRQILSQFATRVRAWKPVR